MIGWFITYQFLLPCLFRFDELERPINLAKDHVWYLFLYILYFIEPNFRVPLLLIPTESNLTHDPTFLFSYMVGSKPR